MGSRNSLKYFVNYKYLGLIREILFQRDNGIISTMSKNQNFLLRSLHMEFFESYTRLYIFSFLCDKERRLMELK